MFDLDDPSHDAGETYWGHDLQDVVTVTFDFLPKNAYTSAQGHFPRLNLQLIHALDSIGMLGHSIGALIVGEKLADVMTYQERWVPEKPGPVLKSVRLTGHWRGYEVFIDDDAPKGHGVITNPKGVVVGAISLYNFTDRDI